MDAYKTVMDSLSNVAFQIPDSIEVITLENKRIKLIDSIPSYTYLGIWSIGCKGCFIDFKEKEKIVEKYQHTKLKFVDICTTTDVKSVRKYLLKFGNTGTHFLDAEGDVKRAFKIQALPTYFLIDGEGKIIEHNFFRPGDPSLQKYISEIFKCW